MADTAKKAAAKKTAAKKDGTLNAAYGAATQRLRDEFRDRFNALYAEEAKQRGLEWKPRLTPAQKAEAQMEALLAEHPELREKFAGPETQAEAAPGAPSS